MKLSDLTPFPLLYLLTTNKWYKMLPASLLGRNPKQQELHVAVQAADDNLVTLESASSPRQRKWLIWSLWVCFVSPAQLPKVWGWNGVTPLPQVLFVWSQTNKLSSPPQKAAEGLLLQLLPGQGRVKTFCLGQLIQANQIKANWTLGEWGFEKSRRAQSFPCHRP